MNHKHIFKVGDVVKPCGRSGNGVLGIIEYLIYDPFGYPAYEVKWVEGEYMPWVEQGELELVEKHEVK